MAHTLLASRGPADSDRPHQGRHGPPILAVARSLLRKAGPTIQARGLTLIGVALSNLEQGGAVQLTLSFGRRPASAVDAAVDEVHERFGAGAITRAVLLGRDEGVTAPLLPD